LRLFFSYGLPYYARRTPHPAFISWILVFRHLCAIFNLAAGRIVVNKYYHDSTVYLGYEIASVAHDSWNISFRSRAEDGSFYKNDFGILVIKDSRYSDGQE
jgi:hypothetical protein